jgi:hypothetical protein
MAKTRQTQDEDVISQLADAGEEALRRLVGLPRRIVGQAMDDVVERFRDVATKLRAIDPLDGRVGEIERRLDSLERPKQRTARRAPTRAKPRAARKASAAAGLEPERAQHDPGLPDDARVEDEPEPGDAGVEAH